MSKEEIIEVIHKTMYQFFDVCGDNEEVPMSDKDELLLSVNKAICNNIKTVCESCSENPNKWIPCSDRLPKEIGFYLVSTTDCITIMEFNKGWISQNLGSCNWYVKAWQPLPKPYKENDLAFESEGKNGSN